MAGSTEASRRTIERVQTGVRMEKRLLLVLKGLAASLDMSLGELLEGIVLHAFESKPAFGAATLEKIRGLSAVYALDLTAADSHRMVEAKRGRGERVRGPKKRPRGRRRA